MKGMERKCKSMKGTTIHVMPRKGKIWDGMECEGKTRNGKEIHHM
jgi:hypothetical protein